MEESPVLSAVLIEVRPSFGTDLGGHLTAWHVKLFPDKNGRVYGNVYLN